MKIISQLRQEYKSIKYLSMLRISSRWDILYRYNAELLEFNTIYPKIPSMIELVMQNGKRSLDYKRYSLFGSKIDRYQDLYIQVTEDNVLIGNVFNEAYEKYGSTLRFRSGQLVDADPKSQYDSFIHSYYGIHGINIANLSNQKLISLLMTNSPRLSYQILKIDPVIVIKKLVSDNEILDYEGMIEGLKKVNPFIESELEVLKLNKDNLIALSNRSKTLDRVIIRVLNRNQ